MYWKELENQGFGWIDTRRMLHARLYIPDYLRLMVRFIDLLRKDQLWLALYRFQFEIRRALYLSLYKRFMCGCSFSIKRQAGFRKHRSRPLRQPAVLRPASIGQIIGAPAIPII